MKCPSETHPAASREESRPFRATRLALFRPCPGSPYPSSLYSATSLTFSAFRDLASFAETGYEDWRTRGITIPFVRPAGSIRRGWFQPQIPLTFRIRGIKHFVREIKRDPRRLVNTREQVSCPSVFTITQTRVIKFSCAPFLRSTLLISNIMYLIECDLIL